MSALLLRVRIVRRESGPQGERVLVQALSGGSDVLRVRPSDLLDITEARGRQGLTDAMLEMLREADRPARKGRGNHAGLTSD